MSHDQWLNQGNPADDELTRVEKEELMHDLFMDLEGLVHDYEVQGLEPEEIERLIRDFT